MVKTLTMRYIYLSNTNYMLSLFFKCRIWFVLSQTLQSLTNHFKKSYSLAVYELYIMIVFLVII
jgi:hypothetical protein